MGILGYLLSLSCGARQLCGGADGETLLSVAPYAEQKASPGVLYYLPAEDGLLVFAVTRERRLPDGLHAAGGLTRAEADFSRETSALLLPGTKSPAAVHQAMLSFYTTQDEMGAALSDRKGLADVLLPAYALLPIPYILVSRDMRLLFEHPSLNKIPAVLREGKARYVEELTQELMLSKRFHDVAKLKEPFYYYALTTALSYYCHNIQVGGRYFARLVLTLPEGQERLPNGAAQLVGWLAEFCSRLAESGQLRLGRHANDAMHSLLRSAAAGTDADAAVYGNALEAYGWERHQEYRLLIVRVFNDSGWDSQMEAPLAVIRNDLEETWPDSCAAIAGEEIRWLIRSAAADEEKDGREFFRQLAVYVRENVCHVGCSSVFRDIELLPAALQQAASALSLGEQIRPSHWIYRFDDYRFDYMRDAILKKGLPAQMLIHPALHSLLDYDAANESELTETLRVYLDCRCNATEAADRLFVHRTTLFRRLERIRELTGVDPNNSDQALTLMLSYRLL